MIVPIDGVKAVRLPEDRNPLKLEACRAYARMINTRDYNHIIEWLHADLKYNSSWVKVSPCSTKRNMELPTVTISPFSRVVSSKVDPFRKVSPSKDRFLIRY